jgi:hypothetical protein
MCEVFPSLEDAQRFAKELMTAAVLLGDTQKSYGGSWGPNVSKNSYRGIDPSADKQSKQSSYTNLIKS